MTRARRVSGAKGEKEEGGGEDEEKQEEKERKRQQAPLTSNFPSTTPACQPACSLFSFELSILPPNRKKKSIHISIIHTPLCLHAFPPSIPLCLPPSFRLPPLGKTNPSTSILRPTNVITLRNNNGLNKRRPCSEL